MGIGVCCPLDVLGFGVEMEAFQGLLSINVP